MRFFTRYAHAEVFWGHKIVSVVFYLFIFYQASEYSLRKISIKCIMFSSQCGELQVMWRIIFAYNIFGEKH